MHGHAPATGRMLCVAAAGLTRRTTVVVAFATVSFKKCSYESAWGVCM
jgi:hypothetical protein